MDAPVLDMGVPGNAITWRMLTLRTKNPESKTLLRNFLLSSKVSFVSPLSPCTRLIPGSNFGSESLVVLQPDSRLTDSIAAKHSSAVTLRLFSLYTTGSADSRPNAAVSPGVLNLEIT